MANGKMSSLEERLEALEQLTAKLESGQLSLDESIQAYTEGMKIALSCKKSLDDMTQKVETVKLNTQKMLSGGMEAEENSSAAQSTKLTASREPESAVPSQTDGEIPF